MSLFKTLNYSEENDYRKIDINNLYISYDHFVDEKTIVNFLDKISLSKLVEHDDLITISDFIKNKTRIIKGNFYQNKNELILLGKNNIELKQKEPITVKISVANKKNNFNFTLIDIYEDDEIEIPKKWKSLPKLDKIFSRIMALG